MENEFNKLFSVFNTAPVAMVALLDTREIVFANDKAESLLCLNKVNRSGESGVTTYQTTGDPWIRNLFDKIVSCFDESVEDTFEFQYEVKRVEERQILMIKVRVTKTDDISGSLAMVVCEDITARHQSETNLRDNEEMYRTMFEHAGFGIALVDPKTRKRVAFNRKLHERLGYTREEYQNLALEDIEYDKNRTVIEDRMKSVFETGAHTFEERHRTKQGGLCHIMVSAVPMNIGGRDLVHAISLEITDLKKMEAELKAKTEELDQFFNSSLDLMCISDMNGVFQRLNPQWEKTLGYPMSDLITSDIYSLVHQEDYSVITDAITALQKMSGGLSFTCRFVCQDSSVCWLQWQVYSNQKQIFAAARDMTQQFALEEQLRQAQKMEAIGTLAGGIAHDFNNMLNVILGYARMGRRRVEEDSKVMSCFKEIEHAANRSADLTQQLLAFSRKQVVSPRLLILDDVIYSQRDMLNRLIGEEISIEFIRPSAPWTVRIDPTQIQQILVNLVVNAKDAITDVGGITIETRNITFSKPVTLGNSSVAPGDYVQLIVSDDGSGISTQDQKRIFEPFFTTKQAGKGTGLGLSTVYGIVKQNEGVIELKSQVGKGSQFKIFLPRSLDTPELKRESKIIESPSGHETILLVEDEPQLLELSKSILSEYGYHVLAASTPNKAIELATTWHNNIQLLITDVIMPQMDGKKLQEEISKLNPNILILFMSGYASNYIAAKGVLDSAVNFIQKPFTMDGLVIKVREILDGNMA